MSAPRGTVSELSGPVHITIARVRLGLAVALLAVGPVAAFAQTDSAARPSKKLFTSHDLKVAGAASAVTIALTVFDVRVARFFQDTALRHVQRGQRLDDIFTHINETTLTAGGILTYITGRLTKSSLLTEVGLHTTEAVAAASLSMQMIRGPLGRSRPHVTGFSDQYDFHPFGGFREFKYRAFPSIHSGSGFAAATVLVAETRRRNPKATWVVAPISYGLALTPGLSRMYLGQHWMSDILAGAVVGTLAGLKVVDYAYDHPDNRVERFFVPKGLRLGTSSKMTTISWSGTF
jgi:membrane-associated phospholipid phosphatase